MWSDLLNPPLTTIESPLRELTSIGDWAKPGLAKNKD